jgi:hypothetical protein
MMSERSSKNEVVVNQTFRESLLWGLPWEGGQAFVPCQLERGGPQREVRERIPVSRLGEIRQGWPEKPASKLTAEGWLELRETLLEPGCPVFMGLIGALNLQPGPCLPQLAEWLDALGNGLFRGDSRPLPGRWARLVAPDWRAWLHGSWTPVLRALVTGERLVLLADDHLPELLDSLLWALQRVGTDLSGLCILWDQRSATVAALFESGVFPEVQVVAPEADRERWSNLVSQAAVLHEAPPAVDLVFGFGVQPTEGNPHLEFTTLTSSCRNLEKPMLQAGENWRSILEQALFESLGSQGALGGYLNGAVGQLILPASLFSVATEWLLNAVENEGLLDPTVPALNRASKAEFEQIRARALGEGATLVHEALGSTGKGQNGTLTRQIFTNVRPGSGLSKAPGNTPTLLLSRGDLGPYEAPYKGGIR